MELGTEIGRALRAVIRQELRNELADRLEEDLRPQVGQIEADEMLDRAIAIVEGRA